jgi:hypothetical protein
MSAQARKLERGAYKPCRECEGTGAYFPNGDPQDELDCHVCHGNGEVFQDVVLPTDSLLSLIWPRKNQVLLYNGLTNYQNAKNQIFKKVSLP